MDLSNQTNRQWRLAKRPEEQIDSTTFELHHSSVPVIGDGEFLVRVCYLSLAPVMRAYVIDGGTIEAPVRIGDTMRGRGVGYIVASRHPDFNIGDIVHGPFGWQDYAVSDGSGRVIKMQEHVDSMSSALGVLGLTGFTAYFGFLDVGRPKAGDNVLVSGGVGGVGSTVGQIAKIAGCRAVAICGSEKKCKLAVEQLGYKAAINYRTDNVAERVKALFPEGIDIYFDNVGGTILEAAIDNIAEGGRIILCGAISQYVSKDGKPVGPSNYFDLVYKGAKMEGFHIYAYKDRYAESEKRMAKWIRNGQLKGVEDCLEGFENMPDALLGLFTGDNVGKRIVKIADEPESNSMEAAQ